MGDKNFEKLAVSRRKWFSDSTRSCSYALLSAGLLAKPGNPVSAASLEGSQRRTPYLAEAYFQNPPKTNPSAGRFYFPTLTPPFQDRATFRYDLGRKAWAFEQLLSFANVTATIRTNVIELSNGQGLWIQSPQWPTGEFLDLLRELKLPVKHIVLPCNALEHKAPMKAFCDKFAEASVWISPGQYGPFGTCGMTMKDKLSMPYRVDGILTNDSTPPWADEFDFTTLYVSLPQNAGPVSEVAFFHRPTKTLVTTDAVVYIPSQAPQLDIFKTYFDENKVEDPSFWPKSVLQAVFLPLRINDDGKYPGYEAIKDRLVRAPILRAFNDARAPSETSEWVSRVASWEFDRILTCHFASPIMAHPRDFVKAFSYLQQDAEDLPPIACRDWELLEGLNQVIADKNLGAPATYDYKVGCL